MKLKMTWVRTAWFLLCFTSVFVVRAAKAEAVFTCDQVTQWSKKLCDEASTVSDQESWDLYLMGYAYHFDRDVSAQQDRLNAKAYGGGFGKHWQTDKGNEHLLFAFVFLDSHDHIEPMVGYAYQWMTSPVLGLAGGVGFAAAITARDDILHYTPVPIIAPVVSVKFNRASLMAAMVPKFGKLATASVVLVWARYEF